MKIAISADSTSNIKQNVAKEIGTFILPLNVIVKGQEYHDDIDITNEQLAKMMRGNAKVTTSTPTLQEIEDFFNHIFAQGYEKVVHFTISNHLSSMYDLFVKTCQELYGDKVVVINSLSVCDFMGNHVRQAIKDRDNGLSVEEIVKKAEARIGKEYALFIPENLTFLKNGGRISPAVAFIGNLIGLLPILDFKDGVVGKKDKTRNLKIALHKELQEIKNSNRFNPKEFTVDILEFDTSKSVLTLTENIIKEVFPDYQINYTPLSINVCAHVGPGTVGIGFNLKVN